MALTEKEKGYQKKWRSTQKCKDYQKKYKKETSKTPQRIAYVKKYVRTPEHKARNDEWVKNNREKVNAKHRRYCHTLKGKFNDCKKKDRKKFGWVDETFTLELMRQVNLRDKKCIYCGEELDIVHFNGNSEYDHFNPFKPFSILNMVKACHNCNKSKNQADVLQWMKYMKLIPSKFVLDLYKEVY